MTRYSTRAITIATFLIGFWAATAQAATYHVTSMSDDGSEGTLRSLLQSDDLKDGDTIVIPEGIITLTQGELKVTRGINIQGAGPGAKSGAGPQLGDGSTVIRVKGSHFRVALVDSAANVTFAGVRISGGLLYSMGGFSAYVPGNDPIDGAGILKKGRGTLKLNDCNVSHNGADEFGSSGGGVAILEGRLIVENSYFSLNGGYRNGGAIALLGGRLTIAKSEFRYNFAKRPAFGKGGAIYAGRDSQDVLISDSTFDGNWSGQVGGAIANDGSNGKVSVINSTFIMNQAADGIAIWNNGSMDLNHITIERGNLENTKSLVDNEGSLSLKNSILAGSNGDNGTSDCSNEDGASLVATGPNIIQNSEGCQFSSGADNIINVNPLTDPKGLADNGGPTRTVALQQDSPAINAGVVSAPPVPTDQRGDPRYEKPDLGAYEIQPHPKALAIDRPIIKRPSS